MTIQFSEEAKAMRSEGLPTSDLVCRLVCARDDPGKERIRTWLLDLNDAQLQSGLGLTVEDIAVLRAGTKTASPIALMNPAPHRIMDAPTNCHSKTCALWRRDPEAIGGSLRAKRVRA